MAECARIGHEKFACSEKYVHWSFVELGTVFDGIEFPAHFRDVYVVEHFNRADLVCDSVKEQRVDSPYEDFKADVDKFLAVKPHFKAIWDKIEEMQA